MRLTVALARLVVIEDYNRKAKPALLQQYRPTLQPPDARVFLGTSGVFTQNNVDARPEAEERSSSRWGRLLSQEASLQASHRYQQTTLPAFP